MENTMKILRFRAVEMHGYLSFALNFRPELTFLTGINGSGKTSAVRAMTALLTPSIYLLSNMEYTMVAVTVLIDGQEVTIDSARSDEEITIRYSGIDEALRIPVLSPDAYEPRHRFIERQRLFYGEQETIHLRNPVLAAIEKLPTPMFLDLERREQEGVRIRRDEAKYPRRAVPSNPLAGSLLESLSDAQLLAEETFRRFQATRTVLTDELKQEIILAAFKPIEDDNEITTWPVPSAFLRKFGKNEEVLIKSLSQIGIQRDSIKNVVEPFFVRIREIANKLPSEKEFAKLTKRGTVDTGLLEILREWSGLLPRIEQVNHLAGRISRYNLQLSEAFAAIERYLTSVNGFLADSNKKLSFDDSGNLQVALSRGDRLRPITALSSGERQLVVILTHLAFNRQAKRANILIIDEPELSLHIRWQELFVDALESASPGLQSILATHSPSIIRGRLDDCIDVEEAQHSDRLLT
jgi:energy-coupling factor transporter ATP-binding protein EcfA2